MAKFEVNRQNVPIGKKFENQVYYTWLLKKYPNYIIEKNVYFDELGVELDFVGKITHDLIEWVAEAKGGENNQWNKGGGARRTDNVKKALNSISFVKREYPHIKTFCFFTYEPRKGRSVDTMLKKAKEWKWLDEVIYLSPEITKETVFDNFYG
jgi:hypothetical protein